MARLPLLALLGLCLASALVLPPRRPALQRRAFASPAAPPVAPRPSRARLFGKTRAIEPAGDGGNWRKRLELAKQRALMFLAIVAARLKVAALKLRAFSATPVGRNVCAAAAALAFGTAMRGMRSATMAAQAELVPREVPWSVFLKALDRKGRVGDVLVSGAKWEFTLDGARSYAVPAELPGALSERMLRAGVEWRKARAKASPATGLAWCVGIAYLLALGRVARQMLGGGVGRVGSRARRRLVPEGEAVTFDSVAGIDGAKREVAELVALTTGPS
mmetsp:Transcript_13145/g.39165  ORF Transcript_13145/g.39165 Transcript_13145/m.39165 type:complete len:276 (+) Transcript_13145:105-932(+)